MNLNDLDSKGLTVELLSLMDKVVVLLDDDPNVDKFLDETDLFDSWELVLPEAEYPIFIMAVINNIRKPSIVDSIIKAITNELFVPAKADKFLFTMGPIIFISSSVFLLALFPLSDRFAASSAPAGLMVIMAAFSIAPIGAVVNNLGS